MSNMFSMLNLFFLPPLIFLSLLDCSKINTILSNVVRFTPARRRNFSSSSFFTVSNFTSPPLLLACEYTQIFSFERSLFFQSIEHPEEPWRTLEVIAPGYLLILGFLFG